MTIDGRIQSLVQDFVARVTALARETAVATLQAQLSSAAVVLESPRPGQRAIAPTKPAAPRRPRAGAKRSPTDLARLERRLAEYIAQHPGERVEQINKALKTKTKDVRLPMAKLVNIGTIKTRGNRRATQYFPA